MEYKILKCWGILREEDGREMHNQRGINELNLEWVKVHLKWIKVC